VTKKEQLELFDLEPSKEDRKKFDIDFSRDLSFGKGMEEEIVSMFQNKKIEVKSEKGMWIDTGNIAIEYKSYGKPSGIEATESDYWFHNLCVDGDIYATLVFKTSTLKEIVKSLDSKRSVKGGDHNASFMYLLNLQKLFSTDAIKKYRIDTDESDT
tara:strand:- start:10968 stop:11435 length:468 start_codon:yes stop_codon:yes gene_type:complete